MTFRLPVNKATRMPEALKHLSLSSVLIAVAVLSGCATYRTDSNIPSATGAATTAPSTASVAIFEGLPPQKFTELGPIEVSVKKLTVFHKDPTREQANDALIEKARILGADAVINVTYKSGIGFTTWGYIDAKGTGARLIK